MRAARVRARVAAVGVRAANEADLSELLPLVRAYCEFYESEPSDAGLERWARAQLTAPEDVAFVHVAHDDAGALVGFAASQWKWSSLRGAQVVLLDDLFVAEHARGGGHADALIAVTAAVARRHGSPLLHWYTAHDNYRAQAVYERVGGVAHAHLEYELEL